MALNVKEGEGRSSVRAVSEAVSMMAQSGLVQVGGDSDIEGIEEEEGEEEVVEELVEASEEEDEAEAVLLEREKEANLVKAPPKSRRKRENQMFWGWHFVELVDFDFQKLSKKAQASLQEQRQKPDFVMPEKMWKCDSRLPVLKDDHCAYFVKNVKASHLRDHFLSFHKDCYEFMEKAFVEDGKFSRLKEVAKQFIEIKENEKLKSDPTKLFGRASLFSYGFQKGKNVGREKKLLDDEVQEIAFLLWMIEAENPLWGMESKMFPVLKSRCSLEQLRSRATLTQLMRPIYTTVLVHRREILAQCGFFSTTFDFWNKHGSDFLGITYHSCTPEWKLFSCVLDLVFCPGKKYSEFILERVKSCVNAHTSNELHAASVTDKGANVRSANAMLLDEDAKFCINHELKKVIDDCLEGGASGPSAPLAKEFFERMRDVVAWIRTSKAENELFKSLQGENALELVDDCATRWEGKFRVIDRFLKLSEALKSLYAHKDSVFYAALQQQKRTFMEDDSFWFGLSQVRRVLEVFHDASMYLQGERYVTISTIPYWLSRLEASCILAEGDLLVCKELKTALLESLKKRCGYYLQESNNALKAAALDPRFHSLSRFGVDREVENEVWRDIFPDQLEVMGPFDDNDGEKEENIRDWTLKMEHLKKYLAKAEQKCLFLRNDKLLDVDPLQFWKRIIDAASKKIVPDFKDTVFAVENDMSLVSKTGCFAFAAFDNCARMLLSIPAGSAPSEREFSSAGRVLTDLRNSMDDETLEYLVVIRDYIKWDGFNFDQFIVRLGKMLEKAALIKK
jgi:hypothetical protein